MARPVLLVVDDEGSSLEQLTRELESRYGSHYQVTACRSAHEALSTLADLKASGADVPLVLADQWMPEMTGAELLGRAKHLHPTAGRGLLISWGDRTASLPILKAAALAQIDFYLPKPAWSPDEQFHRAVTESLEQWWRRKARRFEAVTVIGEGPSARAHEIRDVLSRNSVPFGFHDTRSEDGRAALRRLGVRQASGPVVALFDGSVLVDPTNAGVAEALGLEVRPSELTYDVVVVGAGPAGLASAVYGASEGLSTVALEREAFGGQAGTSSMIRNYLGFPQGVSGTELAQRAYEQAWIFGTHFIYGNPATSLEDQGGIHAIGLEDGSTVRGRAVIIATGVSYRRLTAPGLDALVGAGVFYGAATTEAPTMAGEHAFVVGGGNSAGQAAVHLATYAHEVTVVVRGDSLAASMSEYLIRDIEHAPNVRVRYAAEVSGGRGDGRLQELAIRDRVTGAVDVVPAAALFVLIGAEPFTEWLPEQVTRDEWGYVMTGPDIESGWPLGRVPSLLETSMPGVFAVGDVRHGSVKRVASAVGEGSICIRLVHDYLAQAD